MSSIGFGRSGAGFVPTIQRELIVWFETTLQQHDDKLDVLRDVAIGTANGIESSAARMLWPVRIVCASVALGAVSTAGLFVVELLRLFRPFSEVIR